MAVTGAGEGDRPDVRARADKVRIDDAGVVLPNARKHQAVATGALVSARGPRLADLFPEPDWVAAQRRGMSPECAAHLAMLYDSLATAPKAEGIFGLSASEWEKAYVQAVRMISQFFGDARTLEEARALAEWMAKQFGEAPATIARREIREVAAYWAATAGGQRSMRHPGSFTTRQHLLAVYMPMLGWPESDLVRRVSVVPQQQGDGAWRAVQIKGDDLVNVSGALDTMPDALAECARVMKRMSEAAAALRSRRSVSIHPRSGPDVRGGRDVVGEDLLHEFGFRGVQFGEAVPQTERQSLLNEGWDALCDLAEILCVPRRWLALGAGDDALGLAFGARGKGGAMAHYEPRLNIINLTRLKGRGSLAHEFFHALDRRAGWRYGAGSFLTICGVQGRLGEPRRGIEAELRNLCFTLERSELRAQALRIEQLPQARRYWSNIEELGARAFEAWMQDSLVLDGRFSPLLVHGTLERDNACHADRSPYPSGQERFALAECFEELVGALMRLAASSAQQAGGQLALPGIARSARRR